MSRFSVKRPFVVVVAVIIALILGGVSVTRMKTDLLPDMSVPYLAVITTDPGSSAEKVEAEVTDVLEGTLSTVSGVKGITSTSNDNYSMIFLEFEDGTDMDSALVKVSSAVNEVSGSLPDGVGSPNFMEMSADMMASMYVTASDADKDIYELTDFVDETVAPALKRVEGVADVTVVGSVEQSVEVRLNQDKIDAVNTQLAAHVEESFAEPRTQIQDAQSQIDTARADLDAQVAQYEQYGGREANPDAYAQFDAAYAQLDAQQAQLDAQRAQLDEQLESALAQANIGGLVDKSTLAQLINAQNFAMPAGYIPGAEDSQWLLRVGENFQTVEQISDLVLANVEGVGDVAVSDVADVTVIDNAGDSFVRVNEDAGIMLSVFKTSTASTSEVSKACVECMEELEEDHPGLEMTVVNDQGSYIDLFVKNILQSLLLGALLAVVVLALFLRDLKPTLIVAFSIPFSVLVALVLMYFSDMSLNILTLGGMALAVGMLVDNSIVVLENIYRLRARGISPARAAVQGAKQISGAVVASTLTTICVFMPVVFTSGLVNEMMLPFALSIAFVLCASLVVALTLVPAVASFAFKKHRERPEGWFERMQDSYGRSLDFFLRHKALPILVSVGLLGFSVAGVLNMGVTLMPQMSGKTLMATVTVPEGTTKEDACATVGQVIEVALDVDGVETVGVIDGGSTMSMVSSSSSSSGDAAFEAFTLYIQTDDSVVKEDQVEAIVKELDKKTRKLDCEVVTSASSSDELSSMMGSGLSITVKGPDPEVVEQASREVMALVDEVDGYTEIGNGMEDAADELRLVVDRNELARRGITTAQLYQAISQAVSTEADAVEIRVDGYKLQVTVVDETSPVTRQNLLSQEVEVGGTTVRIGDVATVETSKASVSIKHEDGENVMTVTAEVEDGENNALLSRELREKLDDYDAPKGCSIEFSGEIQNVDTMIEQMSLMALLGMVLIYLIMVAQFQSLLSPFIVLLTIPLAFTGGFLGLLVAGEQLSMLALMGFLVLMGTVVNNGIVFVDYVNQLRRGSLEKRDALIASGRTRMRPIIMTALTTVLSMLPLVFNDAVGGSMQRGMAIVVVGGMLYATFMTLYVVPVMYDLMYRKVPKEVDLGDENIDDDPGDAQAYLASMAKADDQTPSA